jgi:hypothetical protein
MSVCKNVSGAFPQSPLVDSGGEAERLNRGCFCITLDRNALTEALNREVGSQDFAQRLAASHPSLFSNVPAFIPSDTLIEMTRVVDAVETAARLPDYREAVLSWAPPIARLDLGPVGALMSYDFHVTASGPKLIEVNTNAGGAFLNAALARAQRTCCAEAHVPFEISPSQDFGSKIVDMFVAEWQRQRGSGRPTMIAIVDDAPEEQYHFSEFRLAKALLEEYGFETVIADAKKLLLDGKALLIGSPVGTSYCPVGKTLFCRSESTTVPASLQSDYNPQVVEPDSCAKLATMESDQPDFSHGVLDLCTLASPTTALGMTKLVNLAAPFLVQARKAKSRRPAIP